MRSSTLFSPHALVERDVACALESRFDAAWFPDYHRCSIDAEDAFVAVDVDHRFSDHLGPDGLPALVARLGFLPRTALHVHAGTHYAGSDALAADVRDALRAWYHARADSAA